jgi:hypothetical protein
VAKILEKLPVRNTNGSIDLIEIDAIFYLEAKEGDTLSFSLNG